MPPLRGFRFVQVGNGPTARRAGTLLALLGAEVVAVLDDGDARAVLADPARTHHAGRVVWVGSLRGVPAAGTIAGLDAQSPAAVWARSGGLHLTGRHDGPPVAAPGDQAAGLAAAAAVIELLSALGGTRVALDGPAIAGERAAIAGLTRHGSASAGGSGRLLPALGGWVAVNLPRPSDRDLAGAWLGAELGGDPWGDIAAFLARKSAPVAVEAAQELGLGVGLVATPAQAADDEQARARGQIFPMTPFVSAGGPPRLPPATRLESLDQLLGPLTPPRPLAGQRVVDLSSLWAGPLATSILAAAGADVVKVESTRRPDGARSGPPAFFDLLNAGKRSVAVDFTDPDGEAALRTLLAGADLVVEASRPRALEQLGIEPDQWQRDHEDGAWLAITAYGRTGPWRQWSGFGDDAAVAGGMVIEDPTDPGQPLFCADAYADPATGLYAAAVALAALIGGGGTFDVALREVVNHLLAEPGSNRGAKVAAGPPRARSPIGRAATLGRHTTTILEATAPGFRGSSPPDMFVAGGA